MKKRLASLLLCLALLVSAVPGANAAAFSDISDAETAVAAAALQGLGVVSGTPDGSFQPNGTLTRAQVCVMAVNMMGLSDQVNTYSRRTLFTDVPAAAWYNGYVNLAYSQGIINGYGNGTFGPDDLITYGQLATILLRMLGYTTQEIGSIWPSDYTAFAAQLGLSDDMSLKDGQSVTRGQGAVLFYRALKSCISGSDREYYRSIDGVSSTEEAILLDANASYGGQDGLLKVYTTQGGLVYYNAQRTQSGALEGSLGQLLFNTSGKVIGFVPDSEDYEDVTIASATAAALKGADGSSLRVSADVTVIADGETYTYHNGGYLRLNEAEGKTARVFYDGDGSVLCVYLAGGTAVSSAAAVAESKSALTELERELGLSGRSYALTKNGVSAGSEDLAQHDVGYYDAATNSLRVSDYRVTGFLEQAEPSVTAARTVTVAGCELTVLECAWDSLADFDLGDKVTLLLTDDCKVAAVVSSGDLTAEMMGVLDAQGRSVTLAGSGLVLTAAEMSYDDALLGTLVKARASGVDELRCEAFSGQSGKLDIAAGTLGGVELAPACSIYEWAGRGYVGSLEGEQGSASTNLEEISWTDSLSASYVSGYHTNSAGKVDLILLKDVTGNIYSYGKVSLDSASSQQSGTGSSMSVSNSTVTLTNSSGTQKYLKAGTSAKTGYAGIVAGASVDGSTLVGKVQTLSKLTHGEEGEFYRRDEDWFLLLDGEEYPFAENVQLHITATDRWESGEDALMAAVADGCELTLYLDRAVSAGGKIRIVTAS